jgi:hypothetical protein
MALKGLHGYLEIEQLREYQNDANPFPCVTTTSRHRTGSWGLCSTPSGVAVPDEFDDPVTDSCGWQEPSQGKATGAVVHGV